MLFTAAILICLEGLPHTYESCKVINAQYTYGSEEVCWIAINSFINTRHKEFEEMNYQVTEAKCTSWLDYTKDLKQINYK